MRIACRNCNEFTLKCQHLYENRPYCIDSTIVTIQASFNLAATKMLLGLSQDYATAAEKNRAATANDALIKAFLFSEALTGPKAAIDDSLCTVAVLRFNSFFEALYTPLIFSSCPPHFRCVN